MKKSASRVLFPEIGYRKSDLMSFYGAIAPYLLPHLKDRPITLKRYPDAVTGEVFYEKDAPSFTPSWVETCRVPRKTGEADINYILINDRRTLEWCTTVGTIEFHPFLHLAANIARPTAIVFDLDPGAPADILTCASVAFPVRDLLAGYGLKSFAKVSGGKGIQMYAPLNTPVTYEQTVTLAKHIAETLARRYSHLVVARMTKSERVGKVFIDWSQNAAHKTTVGVYSMRAQSNEPLVSVPVTWTELEDAVLEQDRFRLFFPPHDALKRLSRLGDLFAPVLTFKQRLPAEFHIVAAPDPTTAKTKLQLVRSALSIPKRSGQGSRRFYALEQHASGAVLHLEIGDAFRSWRLPLGLARAAKPSASNNTPRPLVAPKQLLAEEAEQGHLTPAQLEKQLAKGALPGFADLGNFELIEGCDEAGELQFVLTGKLLSGEWTLRRIRPGRWKLTQSPPSVILSVARRSEASKRKSKDHGNC